MTIISTHYTRKGAEDAIVEYEEKSIHEATSHGVSYSDTLNRRVHDIRPVERGLRRWAVIEK